MSNGKSVPESGTRQGLGSLLDRAEWEQFFCFWEQQTSNAREPTLNPPDRHKEWFFFFAAFQ